MTQEEFASRIKEKRTTYATWEQEAIFPTTALEKIAHEFGVSFDELVEDNYREAQNLINETQVPYDNMSQSLMKAHAQTLEAKDKLISVLENLVNDKSGTEKQLLELKEMMHAAEQRHLIASSRARAVQEVLLEYLATANKTSFQDVYSTVRSKEAEYLKGGR